MPCRMFHQERPAHRQATRRQRGSLQRMRQAVAVAPIPVSIGFLRRCGAAQAQPPLAQAKVRRACTPWNDTAHIRSRPDPGVPICLDRHNSATGHSPALVGDGMTSTARGGNRAARLRESQGTTGWPPAEDLGKRWRFFPTYAEVQTSSVLRQQFLRTA